MSVTLVLWLAIFAVLAVRTFIHSPSYGLALYLFTYFVSPLFWWWGNDTIGAYRWNLAAAVIYAAAVLIDRGRNPRRVEDVGKWPRITAVAFAINATLVHIFLAADAGLGFDRYVLVVKFVTLFLILAATIEDRRVLRLALWSITLGAAYIGYEATINDRGTFTGGRLEGIGAAGVQNSNELAALIGMVLPLTAGLFFTGSVREKIIVAVLGPMILNIVLLCNSRGTFLALIGGAVVFLFMARGPARKTVLRGLSLGAVALFLLLGDPDIVNRFTTVFAEDAELDNSANYRFVIWGAALKVLRDHPLGSGAEGFNSVYSHQYLETGRAVHNGYLNEALEWGLQGFVLKLAFAAAGLWLVISTSRRQSDTHAIIIGASLVTSLCVLLLASVFGDYLDDEWIYWIVSFMVGYARAYSSAAPGRT